MIDMSTERNYQARACESTYSSGLGLRNSIVESS